MSGSARFIDTNVLLYLFSGDERKADQAEQTIGAGGVISVQVLNEFASVASRKMRMSIEEIRDAESAICSACTVTPLTHPIHLKGLELVEKYSLSVYDTMVVASALAADCTELCSEDMQHGQVFEQQLAVVNPFRGTS